jgi:hypothetical protein
MGDCVSARKRRSSLAHGCGTRLGRARRGLATDRSAARAPAPVARPIRRDGPGVRRRRARQLGELRVVRGGRPHRPRLGRAGVGSRRDRLLRGRRCRRSHHLGRARGRRSTSGDECRLGTGTRCAPRRNTRADGRGHWVGGRRRGERRLLVAIWVSNLPEGIGSASDMREAGRPRGRSSGCGRSRRSCAPSPRLWGTGSPTPLRTT